MKAIEIKIDETTNQRLDKACDKRGENKDAFITSLIVNYLNRSEANDTMSRMRNAGFSSLSGVMDDDHLG